MGDVGLLEAGELTDVLDIDLRRDHLMSSDSTIRWTLTSLS
jgi:hypothetical protein